jgi:uncharacterized protein (TIGR01777 family)
LTGGSGLIGTALKRVFPDHGIGPLQLIRYSADYAQPAIRWDPKKTDHPLADPADLAKLEACDCAVHLAGANLSARRWTAAYKKTILDSRLDSSRALVSVFSRLKTPPRVLVCASATGIYGDRGDEPLTEDSAPGTGYLAEVCKAWEQAAEAARGLGMRVVHLRFGVVLTPGAGAMQKLLPVFRAALGGRLGNGRQWMSWIALEDVTRAILFALDNDSMSGAYNTVSPQPVTNREFTAALGKALHRPAPWIVPAFALRLLFGQMAEDTLLASARALPARLEGAGFRFHSPELESALAAMLG